MKRHSEIVINLSTDTRENKIFWVYRNKHNKHVENFYGKMKVTKDKELLFLFTHYKVTDNYRLDIKYRIQKDNLIKHNKICSISSGNNYDNLDLLYFSIKYNIKRNKH